MALASVRGLVARRLRERRLRKLKAQGLQIADDCRIMSWPAFGSEPYLISIGHGVTIASGVVFVTHDGGTWVLRRDPRYERLIRYGRIVIHDDSFIGNGAILLPGIEIGPRSVIAAGAVVTKTIPPDSVAAGVPAKVVTSIDDYGARLLAETPDYDHAEYLADKRKVLEELYPRPW